MGLCVFHNNKKDRENAISAQSPKANDTAKLDRVFKLKGRGQQAALVVENMVPYLVPSACAVGVYLPSIFAGVIQTLPLQDRLAAAFAAAAVALLPLPFIAWKRPWRTSFNDALKRLDKNLGEDSIPAQMLGSRKYIGSAELWQASRELLLRSKVRDFRPTLEIPRYAMVIGLAMAASVSVSAWQAGPDRSSLLREAFNFHAPIIPPPPPDVRAWVSPPEGIENAQPLYLSNGNAGPDTEAGPVHQGSVLHMSILNGTPDITVDGQLLPADQQIGEEDHKTTQYKLVTFSTGGVHSVQVLNGPSWAIRVEPDAPPEIIITGAGSNGGKHLGLQCIAKDDYGIVKGFVDMTIIGANPEASPPPQAQLPSLPLDGATLCQPQPMR